jgi:cell division protein FtsB
MLEKINKLWSRYQKHPYVQQLKDVRVIGLIAFCAIALLVAWSGLGAIQSNYVLQKQIARLQLKNQYYNTDQYLELQARRQFGRAAPGETLILVPKGVAMSRTVDLPAEEAESKEQPDPEKPTYQKNFEAWIEFFFHRS